MAVVSGVVNTGTGPSNRQKRDMGNKRGSKLMDLTIPIVKRKRARRK